MREKEVLEEKIKNALTSECDGITASQSLKDRIDERILESKKEAGNMKKLSVKKLAIGVAVGCLLVSGGVYAAGRAVSLSTHHYRTDDCRDYGKLSEMEQKLGYRVDAVEKFENGYRFDRMSVNSVQGKDEARNEIYSFQSLNIVYEKRGEESISLFVEKPVETPARDSVPDATRVCGGVTLYYESITNKQVPPDYVLTKEDKEGEARGDFYISVGTPEVEIHQNSTVRWEKDGVQYMLLGFDLNLDAEELLDMAEKIMGTK